MRYLITGGAGFIGSALIRGLIKTTGDSVVNVDKMTYAASEEALAEIASSQRYRLEQVDIGDRPQLERIFRDYAPDAVIHLAAESHVDRSIGGSEPFLQTNVMGTHTLLEVTRAYWQSLPAEAARQFRFHHVSTDEVYGDLDVDAEPFHESSPYAPSSPYSASKAASDHLVRAWHRTYGLPVLITNCSNNYGPWQHPEKLIPLMILNALNGRKLPVYGEGGQIRDWLYVDDHADALRRVMAQGEPGQTYNIGGNNQHANIDVVRRICDLLDEQRPCRENEQVPVGVSSYRELIAFVPDRPGHDRRYAIDADKIKRRLGWRPAETFDSGLEKTVAWYLAHQQWARTVSDRAEAGVITGKHA